MRWSPAAAWLPPPFSIASRRARVSALVGFRTDSVLADPERYDGETRALAQRLPRYEQGRTVPTVAKLDELLKAVAPGRDLLVGQSKAA